MVVLHTLNRGALNSKEISVLAPSKDTSLLLCEGIKVSFITDKHSGAMLSNAN